MVLDDKSTDLQTIKEVVSTFSECISVAGVFGSREDDLDILIIFDRPDWNDFHKLCEALRNALPYSKFFPTFRVQECLRKVSADEQQSVHLLFYPDSKTFLEVERPFTRYCISKSLSTWIGNRDQLVENIESRPAADLFYYQNLLFETGQIFLMDTLPMHGILQEVKKKLKYILKFSVLEVLYQPDGTIDLNNIAETVFFKQQDPTVNRAKILFMEICQWSNPSVDEINNAFQETQLILQDFINEIH